MRSASAPTLSPPPIRTDTHLVEPDEQWKADMRRRIEHSRRHMVEDAQDVRDMILNSDSSEDSHERAQCEYESMDALQPLAQVEVNRELRRETSGRQWTLDMVNSNSPDIARQQQWTLDNVRITDDRRTPFINPNALRNAECVALSTTSQQQGESDSEQCSDDTSEGGYGSAGLDDEEGESDQSGGVEEGGEDEEEGGDRGIETRQPPPDVSLTQSFHSRSPVPRRNAPLSQQQPSDFQHTEDHDDRDAGQSPAHAYLPRRRESQSHSHGGSPRHQSYSPHHPVQLPVPHSPERSGISGRVNEQMRSLSLVQTPCRGSANSTDSNNTDTARRRSGSLNCDQHRGGSVALHSDPGRRRGGSLNSDQHRSSSVALHSDTGRYRSGSLPVNCDQHRGGSVALHSGPGRRRGGSLNSDQHHSGSVAVHNDPRRRRSGSLNCDQHRGGNIALHSDPGRRRAGSLNCDQHGSGSVNLHRGTEHPSLQAHDRIASDTTTHERRNPTSASPHERPSSSYLTPPLRPLSYERAPPLDDVGRFSRSASDSPHAGDKPSRLGHPTWSPRAIPGASTPPFDEASGSPASASPGSLANSGMRRSFEDMRIPRRRTTPDVGSRETSWSSHHPRRLFGDLDVHQRYSSTGDLPLITVDGDLSDVSDNVLGLFHGRQSVHRTRSMHSMRSMELEQKMATHWEVDARRKEGEATRKEEEAAKREDEARRYEEKARLSLEEAERLQAHARVTDASVKIREATVQKRDAEVDLKELETKRREADVHRREVEVRVKEAEVWRKEEEVNRREGDVRKMEEMARHMEDRAQEALETAQRLESGMREAEAEVKMREAAAQKREAEAKRKKAKVKKHEAEVKNIEEQLRARETYLQIREAEVRKMLRAVNGRRENTNLQDDGLERNLDALGELGGNVCLTESRLTQQMAIERQGKATEREDDLVSLASTTRNSSRHDNTGLSSKEIASLKDPGNWTNEG